LLVLASAASAEEIVLNTGERLAAPITKRSNTSITLEHPILGELTIPLSSVTSIDGVPIGDSPDAQPEEHIEPPAVDETPTTTPSESVAQQLPEPQWDYKLELGFNGSAGNTQTTDVRIAFSAKRETETNIFAFDAWYQLSSSNGDRSENRFSTGVFSEWPQCGRNYSYFAGARFDSTEFQSWDYRLTASGGVKYYFIERETLDAQGQRRTAYSLAGRVGAGLRREWGSDDEDLVPEGLFGLDVDWMISTQQNLQFTTTYFPELISLGEFRWVNTFDWVIAINHMDGVSLKVGLLHEYQSEVDPGVKPNDLSVHVSLVADF
jgi:putative salt-induced outer membrane protein YdiY